MGLKSESKIVGSKMLLVWTSQSAEASGRHVWHQSSSLWFVGWCCSSRCRSLPPQEEHHCVFHRCCPGSEGWERKNWDRDAVEPVSLNKCVIKFKTYLNHSGSGRIAAKGLAGIPMSNFELAGSCWWTQDLSSGQGLESNTQGICYARDMAHHVNFKKYVSFQLSFSRLYRTSRTSASSRMFGLPACSLSLSDPSLLLSPLTDSSLTSSSSCFSFLQGWQYDMHMNHQFILHCVL